MKTYTNITSDGMPIENDEIVNIVEGKPRLYNGVVVYEFDNQKEFDEFMLQTYPPIVDTMIQLELF